MVPEGCCSIQVEISESTYRPINKETLISDTLNDFVKVGLLSDKEIKTTDRGGRIRVAEVVTLNPAYIIYDLKHGENTRAIADYLRSVDIESRGRFGEWQYFNMDHSILSGKAAVDALVHGGVSS